MKGLTGKLIAIEGIDQAGKRTVGSWLVNELRGQNVQVEEVTFPDYTTQLGEEISRFLQSKRRYPPQVRQLLYAANRWERADEIRAWLESGKAVVIDRYVGSGFAYGAAQGLDVEWMRAVEDGLPVADVTLLLDITPDVSLSRKPHGRDAYELRLDLLERAREGYLRLAQDPGWIRINAAVSREEVQAQVRKELEQYTASR